MPPAARILQKYAKQESAAGDTLLPSISNQKLNVYLKEIADLCGIIKPLTSHMGRRTFATTVTLANGISIESIAKMLGHSSTKITYLYAVVTDLKINEERRVESKLGSTKE